MEFSIEFDPFNPGWLIPNNLEFLTPQNYLVLANSADLDEMLHLANSADPAAFYLGIHCFQKYPLRSFMSQKGPICKPMLCKPVIYNKKVSYLHINNYNVIP